MRVAVTGTHGIGKTTLVSALIEDSVLKEEFFGTALQEDARGVAEKFGLQTISDVLSWEVKRKDSLQLYLMAHKLSREFETTSFISDRSVVDVLAYTAFYECSSDVLDSCITMCYKHLPLYDKIFYAPIPEDFSLQCLDDGFRMVTMESVQGVDELIQTILQEVPYVCGDAVVHTLSSNRDKWVEEIKSVLATEVSN